MVSKDQGIGWVIFQACVIVAIAYLAAFYFFPMHALWLVGIPVIVAFIAVLAIGAWIGWTMATTPPPKPIEEIEAETETEEKEEKK